MFPNSSELDTFCDTEIHTLKVVVFSIFSVPRYSKINIQDTAYHEDSEMCMSLLYTLIVVMNGCNGYSCFSCSSQNLLRGSHFHTSCS